MRKRLAQVGLVLLAVGFLFLRLGNGSLYWDEAIYAEVAKELSATGDWLTPHWNGQALFHKPPVCFWSTALLFKLLGPTEFAARTVSALAGTGIVVVCYLIARRLFGHWTGILAGLIVLLNPLFISYARFGTTDAALTFFVLLAVYGYIEASDNASYLIFVGIGCGMAIMVKGAAGLVAPAALAVTAILQNQSVPNLRNKWFWASVTIAVLIILPWHLAMYWLHGNSFLQAYFYQQVIHRATTDLQAEGHGYLYYAWVLWEFYWPWVYLLPLAVIFSGRRQLVLIVLAAIVLGLYTIVQTKFQWYVLPVVPAFSILIAGFLKNFIERSSPGLRKLELTAVSVLVAAGAYAVLVQLSHTRPQMDASARLAKLAAIDGGGIGAYPETLEMTVRFYSDRKLCAEKNLSKLSFSEMTACEEQEMKHLIFDTAGSGKVYETFAVTPVVEDHGLMYAAVTRK